MSKFCPRSDLWSELCLFYFVLCCSAMLALPESRADVLTYHYDNQRTGLNPAETGLNPASVAGLTQKWSFPVDGDVYAQPLYVSSIVINGARHNELIVATEMDSVYALDADTGSLLWKTSLVPFGEFAVTSNCGDLPGTVGITGTPVIYRFRNASEVAEEVRAFLADRLKVLLREEGARHDLVDAVFALGDDDVVRICRRVEALGRFLASDDGANLLIGHKRASNILAAEAKKSPLPQGAATLRPGAPPEEGALVRAIAAAEPIVEHALAAEDFAGAMRALAALRGPVDAFFDKVLVNSEIPAERANRLKLLGQVRGLMDQVADFSQVSG